MVKKLVEIGTLFDFYGKLLSQRQYSAVELYYIYDLSLAEIGEELDITRQGAHDTLKRGEQKLYEYDSKLKLINKFYANHEKIKEIISYTNEMLECIEDLEDIKISKELKNRAFIIKNIGKNILDNNQGV